jgi:NTE family protein
MRIVRISNKNIEKLTLLGPQAESRRQWLCALPAAWFLACGASGTSLALAQATGPGASSAAASSRPPGPRFALALGGGAARGFAHVGVISVLEQAGLIPDLIAGTSAGSLVGALYASGMNAKALIELSRSMDEVTLGDWNLGSRSVIKGEALQALVNQAVKGRKIESFPKPFAAVATDLFNGNMKVFLSGDAGLAVRASSSVPSVFAPVTIDGRDFVDGGLSSPIPVSVCRALGAKIVLAVDISAKPSFQATDTLAQVLLQTFAIMGQNLGAGELRLADLVITPDIADISAVGFAQRQVAIEEGANAMRKKLPELQKLLAKASP